MLKSNGNYMFNRQLTVNGEQTHTVLMAFYMVFNGEHRALTGHHGMHNYMSNYMVIIC